ADRINTVSAHNSFQNTALIKICQWANLCMGTSMSMSDRQQRRLMVSQQKKFNDKTRGLMLTFSP
ncbi:MAG: hypothetical protein QGF15_11415, partial [Alteromonas macleodii]|nr:hypothetical protein [Alteromonas macleodii]